MTSNEPTDTKTNLIIRDYTPEDFEAVERIFLQIVARGDSFVYSPQSTRSDFENFWNVPNAIRCVLERDNEVLGGYIVKPNMPGLGSTIANAAYMVAEEARGLRVGYQLGAHSLRRAKAVGYRAMQFNIVVATNEPAVRLWKSLGFEIVGTLPKVFEHAQLGFVDAYVMFRSLEDVERVAPSRALSQHGDANININDVSES